MAFGSAIALAPETPPPPPSSGPACLIETFGRTTPEGSLGQSEIRGLYWFAAAGNAVISAHCDGTQAHIDSGAWGLAPPDWTYPIEIVTTLTIDTAAEMWLYINGELTNNNYPWDLFMQVTGADIALTLFTSTNVGNATVAGIAGSPTMVRMYLSPGSSKAKVWKADSTEPAGWTIDIVDTADALPSDNSGTNWGGTGLYFWAGTGSPDPFTIQRIEIVKGLPARVFDVVWDEAGRALLDDFSRSVSGSWGGSWTTDYNNPGDGGPGPGDNTLGVDGSQGFVYLSTPNFGGGPQVQVSAPLAGATADQNALRIELTVTTDYVYSDPGFSEPSSMQVRFGDSTGLGPQGAAVVVDSNTSPSGTGQVVNTGAGDFTPWVGPTWVANTPFKLKAEFVGGWYTRVKLWEASGSEPTDWLAINGLSGPVGPANLWERLILFMRVSTGLYPDLSATPHWWVDDIYYTRGTVSSAPCP